MLRVKQIMKDKGLSRDDLAEKLNINPVSVSRLINGNPTLESLEKLANVLKVSIRDLFEDDSIMLGFVEYKGTTYKITSFEDLRNLLKLEENFN